MATRLNASKCGVFPISNKRKPLTYMYAINGGIMSWILIVKYHGVYIQSNLSWSHHCRTVWQKPDNHLIICVTAYGGLLNCNSCIQEWIFITTHDHFYLERFMTMAISVWIMQVSLFLSARD